MSKRTCTMPECNRAHRARGLCASHYNQVHAPNRHTKKLVPCVWCETEVLKHSGGGRVYGQVCSDQCRAWLTKPYCVLPPDHWARWYGKSSAWTPPTPKLPRFVSKSCDECGTRFIEVRQAVNSKYCGRRCERRVHRRARKARENEASGTFRWVDVIGLWRVAGKRCAYCDVTMTEQPDPDHVVPISRGGRNDLGNIVPCCHSCNADKCDMTLAEWAVERERLGKPALRYDLPFSDPRFKHLTMGEATGSAWRHQQAVAS